MAAIIAEFKAEVKTDSFADIGHIYSVDTCQ